MTGVPIESAPRVAWITGAGKGIGRALAKRLADDGWTVAVSARTKEDLSRLEAECASGRIHAFPLDITNRGQALITVDVIENPSRTFESCHSERRHTHSYVGSDLFCRQHAQTGRSQLDGNRVLHGQRHASVY